MNKVFVFDTNSLISAALISGSVNKKAFLKAINLGIIAISNQTLAEFVEVLFREKFDSYFNNEDERWEIIDEIYFSENECHSNPTPLSFSIQRCTSMRFYSHSHSVFRGSSTHFAQAPDRDAPTSHPIQY